IGFQSHSIHNGPQRNAKWPIAFTYLNFFILLDIPSDQAFGTLATVLALLPVLLAYLGSLECILNQNSFGFVVGGNLNRGYQHVFQSDFGVLDLSTTGLAYRQFDLGQVLAACAMFHDCRSSLVNAS